MQEWDDYEISWNFKNHPLVRSFLENKNNNLNVNTLIEDEFIAWKEKCDNRFNELRVNEERLNRIFIDMYNLSSELTEDVETGEVTIRLADEERDIKSLISYLVGVVMGRYSLDKEGLIYAGGKWNPSDYVSYFPDDDGVIPIYKFIGIEDGLTKSICGLIKRIYGEDYYEDNINYIAKILKRKQNESAEDAINRYFNEAFFADHLKSYQKRPIYWMLSSGKQGAFKCLIYLHRYTKNTLATVNTKYFLPRTAMYKAERERLETRLASGRLDTREKRNVEAELKTIEKCEEELLEYGQVLDYLANQYIELDLDDGVKENYLKFQRIPLEVNGARVKKDLLVPFGLEKDKK